jgi:hypothetical protein
MAKNKKLNKAVRDRMARTGERYTTARMHILAKLEGVSVGTDPVPRNDLVLGEWVEDPAPGGMPGTLTRMRIPASGPADKPLIVVPGPGWRILHEPGSEGSLQGRFAAPTAEIACLYADDYLHSIGYFGPGIGPLPEGYPPLRDRVSEHVQSEYDDTLLLEGARCECGYVGEDIRSRYRPCPSCGGLAIITVEAVADFA